MTQLLPGVKAVFAYNCGYVFGIVLPPKRKPRKRLRLAVVDDNATYPETGDRQTTRTQYNPQWDRVVATYGIAAKSTRLVGWLSPLDGRLETYAFAIPHFFEIYDPAKEPYTHDVVHDW